MGGVNSRLEEELLDDFPPTERITGLKNVNFNK